MIQAQPWGEFPSPRTVIASVLGKQWSSSIPRIGGGGDGTYFGSNGGRDLVISQGLSFPHRDGRDPSALGPKGLKRKPMVPPR